MINYRHGYVADLRSDRKAELVIYRCEEEYPKFHSVRKSIKEGPINNLDGLLSLLPQSVLARCLNMDLRRLKRKLKKPGLFSMEDIDEMSIVFGVSQDTIYSMVAHDFKSGKQEPKSE